MMIKKIFLSLIIMGFIINTMSMPIVGIKGTKLVSASNDSEERVYTAFLDGFDVELEFQVHPVSSNRPDVFAIVLVPSSRLILQTKDRLGNLGHFIMAQGRSNVTPNVVLMPGTLQGYGYTVFWESTTAGNFDYQNYAYTDNPNSGFRNTRSIAQMYEDLERLRSLNELKLTVQEYYYANNNYSSVPVVFRLKANKCEPLDAYTAKIAGYEVDLEFKIAKTHNAFPNTYSIVLVPSSPVTLQLDNRLGTYENSIMVHGTSNVFPNVIQVPDSIIGYGYTVFWGRAPASNRTGYYMYSDTPPNGATGYRTISEMYADLAKLKSLREMDLTVSLYNQLTYGRLQTLTRFKLKSDVCSGGVKYKEFETPDVSNLNPTNNFSVSDWLSNSNSSSNKETAINTNPNSQGSPTYDISTLDKLDVKINNIPSTGQLKTADIEFQPSITIRDGDLILNIPFANNGGNGNGSASNGSGSGSNGSGNGSGNGSNGSGNGSSGSSGSGSGSNGSGSGSNGSGSGSNGSGSGNNNGNITQDNIDKLAEYISKGHNSDMKIFNADKIGTLPTSSQYSKYFDGSLDSSVIKKVQLNGTDYNSIINQLNDFKITESGNYVVAVKVVPKEHATDPVNNPIVYEVRTINVDFTSQFDKLPVYNNLAITLDKNNINSGSTTKKHGFTATDTVYSANSPSLREFSAYDSKTGLTAVGIPNGGFKVFDRDMNPVTLTGENIASANVTGVVPIDGAFIVSTSNNGVYCVDAVKLSVTKVQGTPTSVLAMSSNGNTLVLATSNGAEFADYLTLTNAGGGKELKYYKFYETSNNDIFGTNSRITNIEFHNDYLMFSSGINSTKVSALQL